MKKPKPLTTIPSDQLRAVLETTRDKRRTILVEYEALGNQLIALHDEIREIEDELDRRDLETDASWPKLLVETGSSSKALYNAAHAAIAARLPDGMKHRVGFSGYYHDTQQRALIVTLTSKPDVQEAVAAVLSEILPHMKLNKATSDGVEVKRVHVMDNTCSENGSLWMAVNDELSVYQLWITRWGSDEKLHTAESLRSLLEYVGKRFPYMEDDDD